MADIAKINGEQSWLDVPAFDPSADFQVAGSERIARQAEIGERDGLPTDFRFGDLPPPAAPRVGPGGAVVIGGLAGASGNFHDEFYGAAEASGLPWWLGGFRAPIGAVRLLYENTIGTPGEATKVYQGGRDHVRQLQKAAGEQHPYLYPVAEVGGALTTLRLQPALGFFKGAGIPARMGNAALNGGTTGLFYGAGAGEGAKDTLTRAATGTVVGALGSAGGGAAVGGILKAGELLASKYPQKALQLADFVAKHPWLMRAVPDADTAVPRAVGAGVVSRAGARVSNALDPGGTGRIETFTPADEPASPRVWWGFP
jgi:hypothetical protein